MSVVNVKVNYIKPTYNNLGEWCNNSQNVYIGRRGIVFVNGQRFPPQDSMWANPYKVTDQLSRENAIILYEIHLRNMLQNPIIFQEFLKLRGKTLGCWCVEPGKNIVCHGHVILKLLNEIQWI